MPYVNKAQARAMHAKAARGEIKKSVVDEFDKATDFKHLPAGKVKHKGDSAPAHNKPGMYEGQVGGNLHNEPSDGGAPGSHEKRKTHGGARGHRE